MSITDFDRKLSRLEGLSVSKDLIRQHIYVDGILGDDNDGDGSEENPIATLTKAYMMIPDYVTRAVFIHLAPHSGNGYVLPTFESKLQANVWIIGEDTEVILGSTAAASGTTQHLLKSSGLVTNQFRGKTIEFLTGAAAGDRRTVGSNTVTDIVPVRSFSAAPSVGDLYRIIGPTVEIDVNVAKKEIARNIGSITSMPLVDNPPITPGLFFENLIFNVTADMGISGGTVHFFGCEMGVDTSIALFGSGLTGFYKFGLESQTAPSSVSDRGAKGNLSWMGWGVYHTSTAILPSKCYISGFLVGGNVAMFGGVFELGGGNIGNFRANGSLNGPCVMYINSLTSTDAAFAGTADVVRASGPGAYIRLIDVDVTSTAGTSVLAEKGGFVEILAQTHIFATGDGIKAQTGGKVQFGTNGTTISATGSDTIIGAVTQALGTYTVGSFIQETPSDGSIIQRIS